MQFTNVKCNIDIPKIRGVQLRQRIYECAYMNFIDSCQSREKTISSLLDLNNYTSSRPP